MWHAVNSMVNIEDNLCNVSFRTRFASWRRNSESLSLNKKITGFNR
jgi:hypothetical protein